MNMIIVNGKNKILGRMCSEIAEKLLKFKENIAVVNARYVVISGDKKVIFDKYSEKMEKGGKGNPLKNPKYPRYPDMLVKRCVRGMLPRDNKGVEALRKLRVYIDVPEEFAKNLPKEDALKTIEHVTVDDLCRHLGARMK